MNKFTSLALLAAGAVVGGTFLSPALAQHHDQKTGHVVKAPAKSTPSHLMHTAMSKMSKNMAKMKMTGDTDKDFAVMMAEHHQGAIEMAEIEVKYGKSAELRAMAKKMIAMQKQERAALLKHAKMRH